LSSPSQPIPFTAGIAKLIDSALYLVRPYKKRRPVEDQERHDPEGNSIHMSEMQREDRAEQLEVGASAHANV